MYNSRQSIVRDWEVRVVGVVDNVAPALWRGSKIAGRQSPAATAYRLAPFRSAVAVRPRLLVDISAFRDAMPGHVKSLLTPSGAFELSLSIEIRRGGVLR